MAVLIRTIDEGVDIPRSAKISETVARELARFIIGSNLAPGTLLPSEKRMAEKLGVGRTTLREGLRLLETFGLVEIRTGRYGGPTVRRPGGRDLSTCMSLAFFVEGSSLLDVLEARLIIEPTLAALAAERRSDEHISRMRATVLAMRDPESTQQDYFEQAREFHTLTATAAGLPVLRLIAEGLQYIAGGEIMGISYSRPKRLATAKAHEAIVDAIEARDARQASDLWRDHINAAGKYWRQKFPTEATQPIEWML